MPDSKPSPTPSLHPRNRHKGRYDFGALLKADSGLSEWIIQTPRGEASIDFSNPEAVQALNRALLASYYGIRNWDLPPGFLCPGVPGRADYIHHAADLLAESRDGRPPHGTSIHALDIGVGASCIYPIIGHCEYGWRFTASDIDPAALQSSNRILTENTQIAGAIQLRHQPKPTQILHGIIQPEDHFDLIVCNPPFHSSRREAEEGSLRKWRNLSAHREQKAFKPRLNFGGQSGELWCKGGEVAFARTLIRESMDYPEQVGWFTILISSRDSLAAVTHSIREALKKVGAGHHRTVQMGQGQKISRFVAWTFAKNANK